MPVVIVEMWAGRTKEQKRQLAEGITTAFTQIGTQAEAVQVIIKDDSKDDWAIGGKLVSDLGR